MNPIFHFVAPTLAVISPEKYPLFHARLTALSDAPESLLAVPEGAEVSLNLEGGRKWEPLLATEEIKFAFALTDLEEEDLEALRIRYSEDLIDEAAPLLIRKTKHLLTAILATIDKVYEVALLNLLKTCEEDPAGIWKVEADRFVASFPAIAPVDAPATKTKKNILLRTSLEAASNKHFVAYKYCFDALPAADDRMSCIYAAATEGFLRGLNHAIESGFDLESFVGSRVCPTLAHLIVRDITAENREGLLPIFDRVLEVCPELGFKLNIDRLSPMGFAAMLGKYHLFMPEANAPAADA